MTANTSHTEANRNSQPPTLDFDAYSTAELEALHDHLTKELNRRKRDTDLEDAQRVTLVNGQFVPWRELSAHPNRKAVTPWILQVTGTHDKYGVDGDWLTKQQIDGNYHMDLETVSAGDIIKVSGESHSNKKHRYYRIVAITNDALYYNPKRGLDEATVIEEVA